MQSTRTQIQIWNERDLIRRLCHALDIASRALEHLAPAGYTDANRPAASIRPEKVIAETGVLLHGASLAAHHHEVKARIHRVARQLIPHARSPQIRLGLALNPALAFDYSLAHVLLTRLGYADESFDRLLDQCRSAQSRGGRERVPHRALEQEWVESLRTNTAPSAVRRIARAARHTILAQPMDLFSSTDEDLYAFTHAMMYATGLALRPVALPRTRAAILAEAEAVLVRCLDAQDYDLAGEILLAWPLTGKSWSPIAAFAFQVLAEVEDKAGFLPTPATRIDELNAREGAERSQYLLATAYHTAFVMGLLCAAALQPGCAPPAAVAPHATGAARRLLPLINQSGLIPHWRATFSRLDPDQADALSSLLFLTALQRQAAARDFTALAGTLRLGLELGLAGSPAASQAAELIQRVATCASALAAPSPAQAQSGQPANLAPAQSGQGARGRELPFGFTLVSASAPPPAPMALRT